MRTKPEKPKTVLKLPRRWKLSQEPPLEGWQEKRPVSIRERNRELDKAFHEDEGMFHHKRIQGITGYIA